MVNYEYSELFTEDNVDKQMIISCDGIVISNEDLFLQSAELTESICSEESLVFGSCEASCFKFKVANIVQPLIGKWLDVSIVLDGNTNNPFVLGKYKVASDKPTSDRMHREIVSYDAMYDVINTDVSFWYNAFFTDSSRKAPLKSFRESFARRFSLEEVLPEDGLANDDMIITKTIGAEQISGKDIITAICEINGCFGHIGRDGKLHYIYLTQDMMGLYPSGNLFPDHAPDYLPQSDTGHLYPQSPQSSIVGKSAYIECHYEDYLVKRIDKIQIRQEENDIGVIYGDGDNCYVVQDNFLVYGKSSDELSVIASNIFEKIQNIIYRPFDCDAVGNPCLEVGDAICIPTKYEIVESYILQRTLKGIQALRDDYRASGNEEMNNNSNSMQRSIVQLKGKSNVLTRTLEETRSEITDFEKEIGKNYSTTEETKSLIKQTADNINLSVDKKVQETKEYADGVSEDAKNAAISDTGEKLKSYSTTTEMNSAINITAEGITNSVDKKITETKEYADDAASAVLNDTNERLKNYSTTAEMNSAIEEKADSINLSVNSKVTTAMETVNNNTDDKLKSYSTTTEMNSAINIAANSITSEVSETYETKDGASENYASLSSSIKQTASGITSTVAASQNKYDTSLVYEKIYEYGYENPNMIVGADWSEVPVGDYYLDQMTGNLYSWNGSSWQYKQTLELLTDSLSSRIEQAAGSIKIEVEEGQRSAGIKIQLYNEKGEKLGDEKTGTIDLTGLVTFNDLSGNGTTQINGSNITTGTINASRVEVTDKLVLKDSSVGEQTVVQLKKSSQYNRTGLFIGGDFESNKSYDVMFENYVYFHHAAYFSYAINCGKSVYFGMDARISGISSYIHDYRLDASGAVAAASYSVVVKSTDTEYDVLGYDSGNNRIYVGSGQLALRIRGTTITSAHEITTSDERLKNSFKSLDEFENAYMDLEPCAFKYNDGTSDRFHFGFKAQNVKESLVNNGFTTQDFAGFAQLTDSPESPDYSGVDDPMGLRYAEFISWNTHMIQKLYKIVEKQQKEITYLKQCLGKE